MSASEIALALVREGQTARFEKFFGEPVPLTEALALDFARKHAQDFRFGWEVQDFDFGWGAQHLLSPSARAAYRATFASADAAFDAAVVSANAEYSATFASVDAAFAAAMVSANASYRAPFASADAAFDAAMLPIRAAYRATFASADAAFAAAMVSAHAVHDAAKVVAFARAYCWSAP